MTINWQEWRQEVFDSSARQAKPVLLLLTAPWCPPGRAAEDKIFGSSLAEKLAREKFIPVRVSGGERPDISSRYGQGGSLNLVFLTAKGRVITACAGEGELASSDLLEQVAGINASLLRSGQVLGEAADLEPPAGPEEKRIYFIKYHSAFVSKFEELVLKSFDPTYGGFFPAGSSGVKYPRPEILEFCLKRYKETEEAKFKVMLSKTLEGMAEGGLFDFLDGGFFRCCRDAKWQSPCHEKLLEDNLILAELYLKAGRVLGDARFSQVGEKTIRFINQWLYNPDGGGFYGVVSGDSGYYQLASRGERLAYREKNQSPKIDQTVYVSLNAAAANLYLSLGNKDFSFLTLNLLLGKFRSPEGLFFHFRKEEKGSFPQFLADQLGVVSCLLNPVLNSSAFAKDLNPRALAAQIWEAVTVNFYDKEAGGFFDRVKSADEAGLLKFPRKVLKDNVTAIRLLKSFGKGSEARQSLVELLWQNKTPTLGSACLAGLLAEGI